jgi:hypothetical protein
MIQFALGQTHALVLKPDSLKGEKVSSQLGCVQSGANPTITIYCTSVVKIRN